MKLKKLPLTYSLVALLMGYFIFSSYSGGISGQSTAGCGGTGCHTSTSTGGTSMTLTGVPPNGWVAGTTYNLTLGLTNMTQVAAGFDLTCSAGTLSAPSTGTQLNGNTEIRHNTPQSLISGTTAWTFGWTAPAAGSLAVTFNVAGNAVNLNGLSSGDSYATTVLTYAAASTATAPTVTLTSVNAINSGGATVNGTVNAHGASTTVTVEYGLTTSYGSSMNATPNTVTGNTATAVSAVITGLAPTTLYHCRIKAVNSVNTTYSADSTFTTLSTAPLPLAPTITGVSATAITTTTATINATVNANNASTNILVEYGLTAAYGSTIITTPATTSGNIGTAVSAGLTLLTQATVYHYRVRAINSVDTTFSTDMVFTTMPTSIQDIASSPYTIYPNPSIDNLILKSDNAITHIEAKIVNVLGAMMPANIENMGNTGYKINTQSVVAGNYILYLDINHTKYYYPFTKK